MYDAENLAWHNVVSHACYNGVQRVALWHDSKRHPHNRVSVELGTWDVKDLKFFRTIFYPNN
jgi:hypothetical protein